MLLMRNVMCVGSCLVTIGTQESESTVCFLLIQREVAVARLKSSTPLEFRLIILKRELLADKKKQQILLHNPIWKFG